MKEKLKSIIGNGLPYGFVFFGLSFLIGYLFHVDLKSTLWMSAFLAISALLINGFIYNRFAKPAKDLEDILINLYDQEFLLIQSPANHLIEDSLVPGKLFMTDRRIIFKAYGTDEKKLREFSWDLTLIKPLKFYSSMWNSGGEFLIETENRVSLMFEVNKLKLWKDGLRSA